MSKDDRAAMDAYLGKNIRRVETTSSLLQSSSRWLNSGVIRELLPVWLLRKNGPDFPVEADHTLGMSQAFDQVVSEAERTRLFDEEMAANPQLAAWVDEGFVSTYSNEDFLHYPADTVGGIIGRQIRDFGFDLTLGMGNKVPENLAPLDFFKLRSRQAHDFEHIVTGGQFNSIGEIVVTFARSANQTRHMSPALAAALNPYQTFAGLRMVTRAMLHYPETFEVALRCVRQGIDVGLASPPFWFFRWEDVFGMTPAEARAHFGVPPVDFVDSERESVIFREDPADLAAAAE